MRKRLLSFFIFILFVGSVSASHLVGGSLGYEYIGQQPSGDFRYKIILTVYNNCDASSAIPLPVASHTVNVYEQDIANNPMGGGNKTFVQTLTLNLVDSNLVDPPSSSGCTIGQSVCIYKGVYEAFIDVPLNFNGYHLFFRNFARNGAISNLDNPGGTAMSFQAYIAPTLVENSSPIFQDDPVPFLCVGDTASILNTAIDPDGDQMIFSFVDPLAGGFGGGGGAPLTWPITPVTYNTAGGYSLAQPFGVGGYAFIDGATGLTQYTPTSVGNYVVAVEIREIRNGRLIGVSRRDLQLLAITCPPNPAPNLSAIGGSGTTVYSIEECDTLTFPINFTDVDGDSLTLSVSGQIFDPSFITPVATIDSLVVGDSSVTANFNWETACGTAQSLPYLFTATVVDNGCPAKTTNIVYQVTVNPPSPANTITGDILVCENTTVTYTTDTINGFTFDWSVSGGSIVSGQGSRTITVDWGSSGSGTVSVNSRSDCGCPSSILDTNITILATPLADAGLDVNLCSGDSIQIGGAPTGSTGTTFTWSPATNIDNISLANPTVWPSTTTDYIVTVDNGTCIKMDTATVIVGSVTLSAGNDTSICIGDPVQLNATGGVSYAWNPSTGLSNSGIANPTANPTTTTTYAVTVTDLLGCTGVDSVTVTVHTLPIVEAGINTSICSGASIALGGSPTTPSSVSTYNWTPGATLSNTTIANPLATPTVNPTEYFVTVTDSNGCVNTDSILIAINTLPTITTSNDTAICIGACTQLNTTGAVNYAWTPAAGLSSTAIANPIACPTVTTTYVVTGTDGNLCVNTDTVVVTVNPLPIVDAGTDQGICNVGSVVIGGTPTGPVGATFSWSPAATLNNSTLANPTATPLATTTYNVAVTDTNGCAANDVVTVTINSLPIVNAGNDTAICLGASTVIGGNPTTPSSVSTYSWAPGVSLGNVTIANPTATPTTTTQYIVTVTDSNTCVNTDTVVITINPLPTILTNNDTAICIGACVQLNATGAVNYAWSPATGLSSTTVANPLACPTTTTTYTVTGTDANGCQNTNTVTITINALPTVNAGADQSICIGNSLTIGGAPTGPTGATFSWTPASTLSNAAIANPIATPTTTTAYTVTVNDLNGCVASDIINVTVNNLPVVDAGNDTTLCIGASATIGGNPTTPSAISTYSWSPTGTLNNGTISNPLATPTVTTQYNVTVTDSNTCTNTDSVVITVNPLPTIGLNNDTSICIGSCVQLNASGGTNYTWTPATGLSSASIANPIACPTVTTSYLLTVVDGNSCSDTASVVITVDPLPIVSAGPDVWVCPGASIQLNATGATTYSWSPTTGLSNASIANPVASPAATSTYIVTGTDGNLCVSTDTITVIVTSIVPIDPGVDTTICAGDSTVLGGTPTSPTGTTFSWFPAGSLDDPTLANPTAFPMVTTTYFVIASNDTCSTIDSVTVTVNNLPPANAGPDVDICIGDTTQLNATGGVTFAWQPLAFLNDSSIANPIAFPNVTTEFILMVEDVNGCIAFDSIFVNVNPLPTINAGLDTSICIGDTIQLNVTGGDTYSWSPSLGLSNNTVSNPFAFPLTTSTYVVTGTDSNFCVNTDTITVSVNQLPIVTTSNDTAICIGNSAQISAFGGVGFNWSPAATLDNSTIFNPTSTPITTTLYQVVVTDANSCSNIDSVLVTVNPLPPVFAGNDTSYCIGDTIQLNATGATIYSWSPAAGLSNTNIANPLVYTTVSTSYILTGTDVNTCVNTDTVNITVNQLPAIDAGVDVVSCLNDSVQLTATGGTSYVWSPTTNINNPLVANPFVSPDTTTTYIVVGTDANSCVNTDSVIVSVFTIPDLTNTTICIGDSLQLVASGPTNASYAWSPATDLSDPAIFNPYTYTQVTITYLLTVTDTSGCQDTSAITIEAQVKPTAEFSTESTPTCPGILVDFTNLSTNSDTYSWNFGDGTQSSEMNPSHTFSYGSPAMTVLTAFNTTGCFDTATFNFNPGVFEEQFDLTPPTVLTPNRDGMNDVFKIELPSEISGCTNIEIFNRWGAKVFDSQGQNVGWDGTTTGGSRVPAGTYFYVIDINGVTKKGSVTLFE